MTYDLVRISILLVILAAAAICDIRTGKIYNWITYPAVLAGLLLAYSYDRWDGLANSAVGLGLGFVPMFVAFLIGGYGGGDAKLMAAVGSLALPNLTLQIMIYGLLAGAAMGIMTMIWRGQSIATLRRIAAALGVILLGRKPADPTPVGGLQVRLGVAIWIGGCWAIWQEATGRSAWDSLTGWFT